MTFLPYLDLINISNGLFVDLTNLVKNCTMGLLLRKLPECSSTNQVVRDMLRAGVTDEGLLVFTGFQSKGRGQGDHSWHSRPGENLLMSLLLRPAFLSASDQFLLSILASIGICDYLFEKGMNPSIKWPNDILTSRGKIAGILIEHLIKADLLDHTIIGIGLNMNQEEFPGFPVPATSVCLETSHHFPVEGAAVAIGQRILSLYQKMEGGDQGSLAQDYRNKMWKIDRKIGFHWKGKKESGVIRGVNRSGELLLEMKGKLHPFVHGEIHIDYPV